MPALKNSRHEAFCRNIVHLRMTTEKAHAKAGYVPSRPNATHLRQRPAIAARIAELQEALTEKSGWDAAKRLELLAEVAQSHKTKDARVTVNAIAEANKMQGSYAPTRTELTGKDGGPIQHMDLSKVTDEDLDKLEAILGPLASASDDAAADQGGAGTTEG